ncbi:MAG TPA: hypothetical protein VNA68_01670 [Candidatus Dormibacteraeota bacterium]|nr:hypothetical protein [Candidatus Dormibacteraeota bacterium]
MDEQPKPDIQPNPNLEPAQMPEFQPDTQPAPIPPEAEPPATADTPPILPPTDEDSNLTTPPAQQSTVPTYAKGEQASASMSEQSNPQLAEDVDVIEKEWVDQANKVVEQTKNDPYLEEEAIEELQVDYLKKRYGHEVKKPEKPGQ